MRLIKKQFWYYIILFFLFLGLLGGGFLTCIFVQPVYRYSSIKSEFEKVRQPNFFAVVNENNPYEMSKGYDKEKLIDFYNYFIETDIQKYTMYSYLPNVNEEGIEIQKRFANMNFFELYDFDLFNGRKFIETDFVLNDQGEIPIIVGYNLKDIYSIGNVYTFFNGDEGKKFNTRVIGVLDKGANYPSLQEIKESLDNSYIIPISDDFQKRYFGLSDYDLLMSSTILSTQNISELNEVIKEANKTDFFSIDTISVEKALEQYENEVISPQYQTVALFCGGLIIVSLFIIMDILTIIKLKKQDKIK